MSLSLLGSAALVVAAQFGQPGFPTQERVQECLPAVSMVMAVAAIQTESDKDPEGKFAKLFDASSMANLHLMAWEQYYAGVLWDDPRFDDALTARSDELATESFAILRDETDREFDIDTVVGTAFSCIEMTREHTLIMNADGSTGEAS